MYSKEKSPKYNSPIHIRTENIFKNIGTKIFILHIHAFQNQIPSGRITFELFEKKISR